MEWAAMEGDMIDYGSDVQDAPITERELGVAFNSEAARLFQEAEREWSEYEIVAGKDYDLNVLLHAIDLYRQSAEQGCVLAMARLYCRQGSYGLPRPGKEPEEWLLKAEKLGYSDSLFSVLLRYDVSDSDKFMHELALAEFWSRNDSYPMGSKERENAGLSYYLAGSNYYLGFGTKRDIGLALHWLKKAVDSGEKCAFYYIGLCYRESAMQKDLEEAVRCFRIAADIDPPYSDGINEYAALYQLAICYENGIGVKKNRRKAAKYYQKAISEDNDLSQDVCEKALHALRRFSEEELGVSSYLLKHAKYGNAEAQYRLGCEFEKRNDNYHAQKWFEAAAEQGHCNAQYKLGTLCGGKEQLSDSEHRYMISLLEASAEQGNISAQVALCEEYLHDNGLPNEDDAQIAIKWSSEAAKHGHPMGKYYYGWLVLNGFGTAETECEGVKWLFGAGEINACDIATFGDCYGSIIRQMLVLSAVLRLCYGGYLEEASRHMVFHSLKEMEKEDTEVYPDVCACIGECYRLGYGTKKSGKKALECYHMAYGTHQEPLLDKDYDFSCLENRIAGCYEAGFGTEQSYREAFRWFNKAAMDACDARSADKVADYYEHGIFVSPDARKARIFRDYADDLRKAERNNQKEIRF